MSVYLMIGFYWVGIAFLVVENHRCIIVTTEEIAEYVCENIYIYIFIFKLDGICSAKLNTN